MMCVHNRVLNHGDRPRTPRTPTQGDGSQSFGHREPFPSYDSLSFPEGSIKSIAETLPTPTWTEAYWALLTANHVNVLLIFLPLAQAAVSLKWGDAAIFGCTFCSMIPLAALLADFTERVTLHTNQTVGGLVNASFGNAPELVFAVQALRADKVNFRHD